MRDHSDESEEREARPPEGTVEAWCLALLESPTLAGKLRPGPPPPLLEEASWERPARPRRLLRPVRPSELVLVGRSPSAPRPAALREPLARARLLHTFAHHELQAAELFAWALLAFAGAPRAFRAGLVRLCLEELEHLALYCEHLATLGHRFGEWPVRDWFWERVSTCAEPLAFVSLLGIGLEGANLEHSARYREPFLAAGDERGAAILGRVEQEETRHVAFAVHWFEQLAGAPLGYERWKAALPAPLTPAVLQGRPLNRAARLRAGLDEAFLEQLLAEPPTSARRSE